jgi:hypothetical protein
VIANRPCKQLSLSREERGSLAHMSPKDSLATATASVSSTI